MIITAQKYLNKHPNSSLKEYIDFVDSMNKEEQEKIKQKHELKNEWYKNLKNKYYVINFNGSSFVIFYMDKEIHGTNTLYEVYDAYYTRDEFKIKKEKRPINCYWFANPYEDKIIGGRTVNAIKEISKEEYDNICSELDNIINNSFDIRDFFK